MSDQSTTCWKCKSFELIQKFFGEDISCEIQSDKFLIKYNLPNRLFEDEPMYCEGLHRPILRGILHAVMAFIQPLWLYFLFGTSHSTLGMWLATIYILCSLFCYAMSALLHCGRWGPRTENFLLKMDHAGIFLMVAGNFIPIGIMCLPETGLYMLAFMWTGAGIGLFRIFFISRTTWWEPIVVGAMALISLDEMYRVMAFHAFWATMGSYLASVVGGLVFANQWPDPWHEIFGFHEIMHVLISMASILVYIANYSVIDRCS